MSYTDEYHVAELRRLRAITTECRLDMREPDEQDVSARVVGDRLDNAMGHCIIGGSVQAGTQELVVIIERGGHGHSTPGMAASERQQQQCFNLADLIALARRAVIS